MKKKIVVLNFSHPLRDEVLREIEAITGEPVEEKRVFVQIDFNQPLKPQMDALVEKAFDIDFNLYIPPPLSYVAAYVTARLSYAQSDGMLPEPPRMVILKKSGLGAKFLLKEII